MGARSKDSEQWTDDSEQLSVVSFQLVPWDITLRDWD